ncbi:phosphoribosylformylglycinamidine cyclo-ligase [Chlamydiota bacterium]
MTKENRLTYKESGVDIKSADLLIKKIKPLAQKTFRPEVESNIGLFSSLFSLPKKNFKNPILVSSTDGVGTKLLLAKLLDNYTTIGIDLVAMCVNDIITCGAEPLFFLDYFATGKLNVSSAYRIIKGIAKGCSIAGCSLIGGETAELPGLYAQNDFDLAGFSVGIVEKESLITCKSIKKGNVLLGIESSGIHSNGFSLARKVFTETELKRTYGRMLLKPTHIYVKPVLTLIENASINGIIHITGGGFYDNIPRVLPSHYGVVIRKKTWHIPQIFSIIQQKGNIAEKEMFRTFNMGIGLVLILPTEQVNDVQTTLSGFSLKSWIIGEVVSGKKTVTLL